VASFATPLLRRFSDPAPQGGQSTLQAGLTATPADAVVDQPVANTGQGAQPGAPFEVSGGLDDNQLRPMGEGKADQAGTVTANPQVPEWAERGKPFFFAVDSAGKRVGTTSVNVVVRTSG
jgi:hypothetical protein